MASLAAAGAVFIYGQVINKNIADGRATLQKNKNAFDPNTISELTRLNDRINATYALLKSHKSVSTFFYVLGNTTLKTVRFTDFTYDSAGEKITISMNGQALNYETVALQSKAFTAPELKNVFKSPIFGDLTLDSLGNVSFGFSASLDPFLVNYYKLKTEEFGAGGQDEPTAQVQEPTGLGGSAGFVQTSPTNQ